MKNSDETITSVKRNEHLIEPGLYNLGKPTKDSPVFVSANYTLSFDALRYSLAAGKGTFGTEELVHRIEATRLHDVVSHRSLIVPQLGATGVAAHHVRERSGFKVEFGPVRAADLPEYHCVISNPASLDPNY